MRWPKHPCLRQFSLRWQLQTLLCPRPRQNTLVAAARWTGGAACALGRVNEPRPGFAHLQKPELAFERTPDTGRKAIELVEQVVNRVRLVKQFAPPGRIAML